MADPDKTVFLSYRRNVSWKLAYAVRYDLEKHGFDVFMDTKNLGGGEFARAVLSAIEERAHFLVLVEPPTLLRIAELDDWLRREIAHALAHRRNVVPLLVDGVKLPPAAKLPAEIARLSLLNAVEIVNGGHFPEVMQKLRTQFLQAGPPSASSHRARATGPSGMGVEPCDEDVSSETVVGPTLDPSRPAPEWAEVTPLGGAVRLGWRRVPAAVWYTVEAAAEDEEVTELEGLVTVRHGATVYRGPGTSFVHKPERSPFGPRNWLYHVRAEFEGDVVGPWSREYVGPYV